MYQDNQGHIWGPDTQADPLAPENLSAAGRLIDRNDPAITEIVRCLGELAMTLGNLTDPDEETVRMAIRLGQAQYARAQKTPVAKKRRESSREASDGVVYYIRRGPLIKIGTTRDLRRRMATLLPEEILAIEPGSHTKEAELHQQFAELRVDARREWFYAGRLLQEHIHDVRERHGEPDPTLPVMRSA